MTIYNVPYKEYRQNDRGRSFQEYPAVMAGQPAGKGDTAEGKKGRPGVLFWGDAEYAAFCHGHVERYHGFFSFELLTMNDTRVHGSFFAKKRK